MFRYAFNVPGGGSGGGAFRMFIFLWFVFMTLFAAGWINGAMAQQPRFPRSCCGEYDCLLKPVPRTELERRADGWFLLKERFLIPFDQVRPSPDAGLYICRTEMGQGHLITPPNELPCLFMPESEG